MYIVFINVITYIWHNNIWTIPHNIWTNISSYTPLHVIDVRIYRHMIIAGPYAAFSVGGSILPQVEHFTHRLWPKTRRRKLSRGSGCMHPPILYLFSAVYDTLHVDLSWMLYCKYVNYLVQVYWAVIIRGVASGFFRGGVIQYILFADCKYT